MSRFYVPSGSIDGKTITITGEEAHHIIDVMRLGPSDGIIAFDGTGKEYVGIIRSVATRSVIVDVIDTRTPASAHSAKVTLIQSLPKKAKMDYIVEKATELGVSSIVPVLTKRTIPDWDQDKKAVCVARWRKIAVEASKQCGRADVPLVSEIGDFVKTLDARASSRLALIATLAKDTITLRDALGARKDENITIAIGPEGDFTPEEVSVARAAGFKPVSLGLRVLKSDTAGLAALAVIDYATTRQL